MQIIVNFDDIEWLGEGMEVGEHFKREVVKGLQDRLTDKLYESLLQVVNEKKDEIVERLQVKGDEIIDTFLKNLTCDKIETLKIPKKKTTYSSDIKYLPVAEYIGERYEKFIHDKIFTEKGELTTYQNEAKYSITEYLFNKVFGTQVKKRVAETIADAREKAEVEIIGALENTLKEHLTADIVKKINVPDMLKKLQEQYGDKKLLPE